MKNESEQKLEIYKLFVASALAVTNQRLALHGFFATINSVILNLKTFSDSLIYFIVAVLINLLWCLLIVSYKELNTAKFKVINKMEEELPFSPFKKEWESVKENKRIDFTKLEQTIPLCFCITYFVLIIKLFYP